MKTIVTSEDSVIEFSDDGFDSPAAWVQVSVKSLNEDGEVNGETSGEFLLSELMPALIAFDAKESRKLPDVNQ